MASVVAHAVVPLVVKSAFSWPKAIERRLTIAVAMCAIWPDIDLVTLAFEIRPNEPLGHRGLTHSILVGAIVAFAVALAAFRGKAFWGVVALLFGASALHGLVDAMTAGDVGVALFAPITNARFSSPFKLFATCPAGVDEFFGPWGALAIANELLYLVIPTALVVTFLRPDSPRLRIGILTAGFAFVIPSLRSSMPQRFAPSMPRVVRPIDTEPGGRLADLPSGDLPDGKLVTKLSELRGYMDRPLVPARVPWSSSFFPSWFGGWAGRWQDGAPKLALRTLFGFPWPTEAEGRAWLRDPNRVWTLSPTEKIDLARERFDFPATQQGLMYTHDRVPKPRYWYGLCNGVAAAAIATPEPFRAVDVITASGAHVRFHPNDIKALLAVSFDEPGITIVGQVCTTMAFDAVSACAMNPGVFVIAALDRIGIARTTFLVDALPTIAKQYYAVAGVTVRVTREPYDLDPTGIRIDSEVHADKLVDVAIDLVLSSTTLSYAKVDRVDAPVGLVPYVVHYSATLALANDAIVGGAWTSDDAPDDILFVGKEPVFAPNGNPLAAYRIPWPLVVRLAQASAGPVEHPTIDLRAD